MTALFMYWDYLLDYRAFLKPAMVYQYSFPNQADQFRSSESTAGLFPVASVSYGKWDSF